VDIVSCSGDHQRITIIRKDWTALLSAGHRAQRRSKKYFRALIASVLLNIALLALLLRH
jgi:hypothetical protein